MMSVTGGRAPGRSGRAALQRVFAAPAVRTHMLAADISQLGSPVKDRIPQEARMHGNRFSSFISGRFYINNLGRCLGLLLLGLSVAAVLVAQERDAQKKGTGTVLPGVSLDLRCRPPRRQHLSISPDPITKTLTNGVHAYVVSGKEEPMVSVRVALTGAGSVNNPAGMPGVANMTADMLTQGTATRSAEDIAQAIDFVGGSLSASADEDGTYVTVTVVKKDFALAMDLLSDILLHPSFKKEELDRRRQQALSDLTVRYSDPEYVADVVLGVWFRQASVWPAGQRDTRFAASARPGGGRALP